MKTKLKTEIIFYIITLVIVCITLFFSSQIENVFKLKPNLSKIYDNSLSVHFVDVGQGDAILIKFPNNKTMLIDGGNEDGKSNLLTYIDNVFFENLKAKKFDYVLLSHTDNDHMGNMLTILNRYKVGMFIRPYIYAQGLEVYDSYNFGTNNENYLRLVACAYKLNIPMKFAIPEFYDEFLSEYMNILTPIKQSYSEENCFSPILTIEYNNVKVVLTGDATTLNEIEAINNYDENVLNCDILKLGHHGSSTSTSAQFLQSVSPNAIVISAGKNNTYLHPSRETMDRIYEYANAFNTKLIDNIYETYNQGNIIFSVKDNGVFDVTKIKNVNDYAFVSYWLVLLIVLFIVVVFVIVPNIINNYYKTHAKIDKVILKK